MGGRTRALRRRVLTPSVVECSLEKRGFFEKSEAARDNLETVGATFLDGYGHAVEARDAADAHERLDRIAEPFRGFAYEGAGMGAAMLDGLPLGGQRHVTDLLSGPGDRHVYMIYVGVGWAMARLPRFRWPAPASFDPLLRGLVLDGYGFHQAYFHTRRYVHERYRDAAFPWPDGRAAGRAADTSANSIIDQGIGRAMWFVGGTDVGRVTDLIDSFPADRRADLYAGTGLAATYAGGVGEAELVELRTHAGEYRVQLAQGSAFAAEARIRAGLVQPHTAVATGVLCGTTPARAAQLTQDVRPRAATPGLQAYQSWRPDIAAQFAHLRVRS